MTKKKAIVLSVIALLIASAVVFLFVSPQTITFDRTVRFYILGDEGYTALENMENDETLNGKFEYIDIPVDIKICKSIFKLDSGGNVIINGANHSFHISDIKIGSAIMATLTKFRFNSMHTHYAVISEGYDFAALDHICASASSHRIEYAYGRLSGDLVTAGNLKQCLEELGHIDSEPFSPYYTVVKS